MHILFIDDMPDIKVKSAIYYLEAKKIKFSYTICKSINSALRYFAKHFSEIDLIVVDFGLPQFDGDKRYIDQYGGLDVIDEIVLHKEVIDIPIIINSTTKVEPNDGSTEKEYFSFYAPAIIEHVDKLDGKWLLEFLKSHFKEKIELL